MSDFSQPSSHPPHLHDYIEIYVYISGDVDFIIKDNYISLKKGDIIITKENIIHKPIINGQTKYERFYIGIPRNAFFYLDNGADPLAFINSDSYLITLTDEEYQHTVSLLNRISSFFENGQDNEIYYIFSYFLRFLRAINTFGESHSNDIDLKESKMPALISEVLKYIDSSVTKINSVKELANRFHVNPSYLSSLFSTSTHVNLKHYLTTKKISEAKNLLLKDVSISDIAYEYGYSTCSHFISVFKQITGKTPTEYRKEMKT